MPSARPWHRLAQPPWHPVVLTVVIVIAAWQDTAVNPAAAIRALLVASLSVAIVTLLFELAFRRLGLGAALLTALIAIAWSKHLFRSIGDVLPQLSDVQAAAWLALIGLAFVVAASIGVRAVRRLPPLQVVTARLNLAAGLLLIVTVAGMLVSGRVAVAVQDLSGPHGREAAVSRSASEPAPDIYLILLDGYARADVLEARFGLDNQPFHAELSERGFAVAARSRTPYLWTHVVLPSLLHMDYRERIDPMRAVYADQAPARPTIRLAINDNAVFTALRERGYTIHATSSGWEEYSLRGADVFFDGGEMNDFELHLLESTFIGDVIGTAYPDIASSQVRGRIVSGLHYATEVASSPRSAPRVVLVHVPAPHQPIVFGPRGEPVTARLDSSFFIDTHVDRGVSVDAFTDAYAGEVAYLNKLVLGTVDGILEASPEPPVIIVMSDHGSASRVNWHGQAPADARPADLLERTGTLFAALTPGRSAVFPADVTPVDVFRHTFDAYFGTSYGTAVPPPGGAQIAAPDPSVLRTQD